MINKIKHFRRSFLLAINFALVFLLATPALALTDTLNAHSEGESNTASHQMVEGEHEAQEAHKFDAGGMIMDHVGDSHSWHLWGHTEIPLPVILYTDKGLEVFSSANFEHGHATYAGNYNYRLIKNKVTAVTENNEVDEAATDKIWDFSITKNVAAIFISSALLLLLFSAVAKSAVNNKGKAPKGLQAFLEPLIVFVRDDIAKASIGEKKYEKYLPFLLTVFFFILINNLLGLVPVFPGGTNLTGNISIALTLAAFTLIITFFSANKAYWRHVFAMPGVPVGLLIILTPIEIMGLFLRPFVLMIRLFANITAGHIIALSFFSLIFIFGEMNEGLGWGVSVISLAFTVFMTVLELLVAFLQAYVFTLLSAIYFGSAVEEHEHHHPADGHSVQKH